MFMRLLNYRTTTVVLLALILSAVAFGFAAANSVPESGAGDGSGAISGYTITNIQYTLDGTDPSTVSAVSFDINATAGASAAAAVEVQLDATWANSCSNTSGVSWTCTFTGTLPDVSAAATLQVVATD